MSSIDVVISGIGGRFPKSRNIKEFSDNLLSGESLLRTIDRWPAGLLNTPKLAGLTEDINRFDYTFFGMHFDLCKRSDAQLRTTIETAFEALIDAGVNPTTIRGSNAHVYTATSQSDFLMDEKSHSDKRRGYLIVGKNRCMSANRISYFFNLSGHSCAYDASSGWLGAGLAFARKAIQSGECDTAFVTASSAIMLLEITKQKQNMGLLSPDSTCHPFATDANGVPQGEAQVTFLVQRADIAKRSYGSIVLAGAESRLTLPNWFLSLDRDHFQTYISSLYRVNGIDPNKVKLLEADGLAIKDMVEVELNVLDTVLNEKRPENSPLYVGTVKSVTGDTEASAGHTALTKLILAMETGVISPTLDYGNLNPNLRGIAEGRLQVVTEPTKWDVTPDTHVAVSTLSATGLVSHVVLRANGKTKRKHAKNANTVPYLLLMSGRTESFVHDSLNTVASSTFDPEYLRLTQEVFALTIDKFEWKGYGFHDEPESFVVQIHKFVRKPQISDAFPGVIRIRQKVSLQAGSPYLNRSRENGSYFIPTKKTQSVATVVSKLGGDNQEMIHTQGFFAPAELDDSGTLTCRAFHFSSLKGKVDGILKLFRMIFDRENRRPVWFVYSGMGSQWPTMGKDLMAIPIINETFQRLHKILEPKGIDLMYILTTHNADVFDSILHSFVGIAAVQIALTNVLRQLGVVPDGMIGHSVGEIGCSYADDCLTEEQTILSAYERGVASLKAELIPGFMAAVGLGHKEVIDILPPDVYVACHNSRDNCSISGPTESVKKVVAFLEEKGTFVRGVNVSNIAYHSPYIRPAAPLLFESLRKVIPSPKLRSSKWICTSALKENWDTDEVRYCSAEYLTNNLLGKVLFEEGSAYIPDNALLIEIAPHGLLQAILKRSFGNNVANVPLTRRGAESSSKFLLEAIGKLFLEGLSLKIWHLYPDVEMPVSRSTPSLAPLVKWEHSEKFPSLDVPRTVAGQFFRCLLNNHCPSIEIAGSKCYPAANALIQTYNSFAELMCAEINTVKVMFEGVRFYDIVRFDEKEIAEIVVTISPTTGAFCVTRNDVQVVNGRIQALNKHGYESKKLPNVGRFVECPLSSDDIYSEVESRGLVVPKKLKNIQQVDIRHHDWIAKISNDDDYASLINSFIILFQLGNESVDKRPASVSHIKQLIIDPASKDIGNIDARLHLATGTLIYPGFSMSGVEFRTVDVDTTISVEPLVLRFVPFGQSGLEDEVHFLSSVLQLSSERRWQESATFSICDIDGELTSITDRLHDLLKSNFVTAVTPKNADLIVCGPSSIHAMASTLSSCNNLLLTRSTRSDRNQLTRSLRKFGLDIIAECNAEGSTDTLIAICSLPPPIQESDCQIVKMKPCEALPTVVENTEHRFIIFVWENDTSLPVEKMLRDAMFTGCAEKIRLIIVMTPNAPSFSLNIPLYADQLRLDVPLNIYLDGKWGNYRLLPIAELHQVVQNGHENFVLQTDIIFNARNGDIVKLDHASIEIHDVFESKRRPLTSKKVVVYCTKYSDSSIIGVATLEDESTYVVPDTILSWTVPEEWCCGNAAPVLFSFAMAYYILFEMAHIPQKKRMLVTCPLTSLGLAVIRVANSLNCEIVILVSSEQEKQQVRYLFPELNANIIASSSESFSCILKIEYPEGVHLIVSDLSGDRLIAGTECLHDSGIIVQVDEDAMLNPDDIGMNFFVKNAVVYGVPPQALLNAIPEVKRQVQQWVDEGLKNGIVVPESKKSVAKLDGSVPNGTRASYESNKYNKIKSHNGMENGSTYSLSTTADIRRNSAVIIGGSKAQWIKLSYCLALKGCQLIALKQANTSPNLISRHSKIIRREFDVELRDVTNVHLGTDLMESDLGNLSYIFVFGNNSFAEEVIRELGVRELKDVRVLLFSKNSNHSTRMCERWTQKGLKFRAALGIEDEPICKATLDWLLSPSASTVSVLNQQAFVGLKVHGMLLTMSGLLPTCESELQVLGAAIRKHSSPIFEEIATRGMNLRHVGEVNPLFFIKGIHETADSELETLASGLLAPLVGVTLHAHCGTLDATAAAVVQGMLRIQKKGPFNLAGDTVRSNVVIEVARILEGKGYALVIFLMNEQIANLRESLNTSRKLGRLDEMLLKTLLSESTEPQSWNTLSIGNVEWSEQVRTAISMIPALSEEHKEDVVAAFGHVYDSLQHILGSRGKAVLEHGIVRLLRVGEKYRECELTDRCFEYTIPATKLKRKELADFFSANLATPVLQLRFDRERR